MPIQVLKRKDIQAMAYTNSIGVIQEISHFFNPEEKMLLDQMVDAGLVKL